LSIFESTIRYKRVNSLAEKKKSGGGGTYLNDFFSRTDARYPCNGK